MVPKSIAIAFSLASLLTCTDVVSTPAAAAEQSAATENQQYNERAENKQKQRCMPRKTCKQTPLPPAGESN